MKKMDMDKTSLRTQSRPFLSFPLAMMVIALLLTSFVVLKPGGHSGFGVPQVSGGDEPHYLLILNSLIRDHDLDLKNNYAAAYAGDLEAGRAFSGRPLDHHTTWFSQGKRFWGFTQGITAADLVNPNFKQTVPSAPATQPEYSTHPVGSALFTALFVFPLQGTSYVEAAALFISALLTAAALLFFRGLLLYFGADTKRADAICFIAFFCTPVWYYARTVFSEVWLLLFLMAACYFGIARRSWGLAGLFIGLGILIKPPIALLALPMLPLALRSGGRRAAASLLVPILCGGVVMALLNWHMFGAPWRSPQDFSFGNPVLSLLGLTISWKQGLFTLSPVLIIALVSWVRLLNQRLTEADDTFAVHRPEFRAIAFMFLIYFGVMCLWTDWTGGSCYGPRLILPVVPLLALGMIAVPAAWLVRRTIRHLLLLALVALSFILQVISVARYWQCINRNPIDIITTFTKNKQHADRN